MRVIDYVHMSVDYRTPPSFDLLHAKKPVPVNCLCVLGSNKCSVQLSSNFYLSCYTLFLHWLFTLSLPPSFDPFGVFAPRIQVMKLKLSFKTLT